jgi:prepilin-type N-terminal cleavage/methylation domain-containing protein
VNRMGCVKRRRGFTLIELIIAVALLAVAGTVVVRLFVHAHVNNQLAADIDRSVFYGSAWIEKIKSSPEDWICGDPSESDSAVTISETCSYIVYYDDGWIPLHDGQNRIQEAEYAMHIDLYKMNGKEGLWAIELGTYRIEPYPLSKEPYQEIYTLSAMVSVPMGVMAP